jgi:lipopolysaccharide transport system permease protein
LFLYYVLKIDLSNTDNCLGPAWVRGRHQSLQNDKTIPTTLIKPAGSSIEIDASDIWRHRELLYFLTLREIKIRYKQTVIGVAWAVLQPVLTVAIFSIIFSRFAQFDTGDIPYPLVALSGLILWLFIHSSVTTASNSFITNTNLVTKVYFPRLIMPVSSALSALVDLMISVVILVLFMAYYHAPLTLHVFIAPLFVVLAVVVSASMGTLFSALNVRFRDVQFALPFLLQVWMIASPVFYPASVLPEKWRWVFAINPLTGILDGFRSALFGIPFHWPMIGISVASLMMLSIISLLVFKWMEDDFADIV